MLEIEKLQTGYGRTQVISGVSLTVPDGAVVSVLGHNGAGKTTLLRAVVGLLKPTAGRISLDGEDIAALRPHRRVDRGMAYVPQGQQSFAQLSVLENLQLVADGRRNGAGRVAEALDMFPALRPLLARRAGLLSGGQRQQLAIARALITDPRLLILDEPTEGIQPNVVAEIEATIIKLSQRNGMSILLVEQHIGFALQAADSYYVLSAGRVSSSGAGGAGSAADVRKAMLI
ncbi:urea ABC transporter ATP-binding subunit UrtE [Pseudarthrobacter sp. R1]|uniref:urea ABC transporter ATP-binding subunit UrtE n=1 Tax=Pseudarthrobacter sp. R1 TaxID=2944934 RepID=UPI00210DB1C4|nr:urea ABC transporter ATP-binding subunit UrtE [Pseudarthrobacter sp. R1]MCQ6269572.1 urea ABC transporter ATP-binding subunit UrtE [Pseudarthrobacter sp. R1]